MARREALGFIETVGLTAAIQAADVAVKSANVNLLGYELTKGGGMVTVKISGDVGAVKAAIDAAVSAASQVSRVVSSHVIARPHPEVAPMIDSPETIGRQQEPKLEPEPGVEPEPVVAAEPEDDSQQDEEEPLEELADEDEDEEADQGQASDENEVEEEDTEAEPYSWETAGVEGSQDDEEVCNLCGDPACPRRKGEPRIKCLHHEE